MDSFAGKVVKELEHLTSMWDTKVKRNTELIIPKVTYTDMSGSLNNDHWEFIVPYAFRDALDIKYEERKKNKRSYMVWTQGPILSFKEGDLITSKDGKRSVQVKSADSMKWNKSKNEMYKGSVIYEEYKINNGKYEKSGTVTCSQMNFLELLIYGRQPANPYLNPTA